MDNEIGECLLEAHRAINGIKQEEYGPPKQNINDIAEMWSTYLDVKIYGRDVCNLFILSKVCRDKRKIKHDNPVDISGFAGISDSCFGERK